MSSTSRGREPARGRCLCNAVRFEVHGPLRAVVYCHCHLCRRASGHYVAATACRSDELRLLEHTTLQWFRSSPKAERGFCARCGSNLFWRPADGSRISIFAGSLERPTGLRGLGHIHVAEAGDYYQINDGLAQAEHEALPAGLSLTL